MIKFSPKEVEFLDSLEEARLATSHNDMPHVKPVSFIYHKDSILIATDYKTRSFKNLKKNPNASVVIDLYKHGGHKAICLQGRVMIIDSGPEFDSIFKLFYKKFQWVRDDPWEQKEAPFLKIIPTNKTSWGI